MNWLNGRIIFPATISDREFLIIHEWNDTIPAFTFRAEAEPYLPVTKAKDKLTGSAESRGERNMVKRHTAAPAAVEQA